MASKKDEIIICGKSAVLAQLGAKPQGVIKLLFHKDNLNDLKAHLKILAKNKIGYEEVDESELEKISKSTHHEGLVLIIKKDPVGTIKDLEKVVKSGSKLNAVYLGEVQNPHNLGAIIRSAAHFGFINILVEDEKMLDSSAAFRTAEGGRAQIKVYKISWNELKSFSKTNKVGLIATSVNKGENIFKFNIPKNYVIIFGEEAHGLEESKIKEATNVVTIPGTNKVESLNVSCAASVIFAELYRKSNFLV